jgi:serine/threonine protein kinase
MGIVLGFSLKDAIRFGKYLLLQRINVGGMAEVFKAKTFGVEGFEKLVAIKRILPSIAEDDEFIRMFIDEAKITVRLQHANIAQVYELGKIEDNYFIAMEFINGKDLKQLFERNKKDNVPMDIAQASYITSQICAGLDYAHRKKDDRGVDLNIIHRDVSPQNIRISYDGEVKVIDFGIAKAKNKSSKTEAGILKGKFGYMSPEQVRGKIIDRRSDIFAIGIIFYELITGTRLFQGETDFSTLEKIRNVEIELPSKRNPVIPKELEDIVMKALTSKRDQRYSYAHDMHDDLQKFMILNNYMYSRTDLATWMKSTYSKDIENDFKLLKQYDSYDNEHFENLEKKENKPAETNNTSEAMEWDDDELETQIFDKSPSFVGENPEKDSNANRNNDKYNNLPKKNLAKVLDEKKKKQKKNKNIMIVAFSLLIILLLGVAYTQFFTDKTQKEIKYLEYEMSIDLQVVPNKLFNIFLDNKPLRKDENSPYLVKNIKPGEHELKIEKEGYITQIKKIKIPKLTKKDADNLNTLQNTQAIQDYGITYDQYITGITSLKFELEEKSLEKLTINVTPSDNINIYFDEKLLSNSSPYSLKNIKPGKYNLKITKENFKTYSSEIVISNDDLEKITKEITVKLEEGKLIPITIKTLPNTSLSIDGKKIEGSTPYAVNVTEGKHIFKVSAPLFKTETKEFLCKENSSFSIVPKQKYVELKIDSKPEGAKIYLFDKDNLKSTISGEVTPVTKKIEINNLTSIKLEKDGYPTTSLKYTWNKKSKQTITIVLKKEEAIKIVHKVKKTNKVVKPKNTTTKYGYISIISRPATSIKVDGRNLGRKTPLIKFKIPAGKHKITLYDTSKGINDSFTTTIIPDKVKPIIKKY